MGISISQQLWLVDQGKHFPSPNHGMMMMMMMMMMVMEVVVVEVMITIPIA